MSINLSILKDRFFPSFYTSDAPKLIDFFGYYLEWMEKEENPYWTISKLSEFTDIDGSVELYSSHLKNELMVDFPIEYAGNIKYIMKHLVKLYQSKGTIDSLKFFFRAMYNSFCEVSYPREQILKVSDGKWSQGYYIYTEDIPETEYNNYVGKTVTEVETGLTGLIDSIIPHYFENDPDLKYVFVITDNVKAFTEGNTLRVYDSEFEFSITRTEYSQGYWTNTDGLISADRLLQDGFYYQNFSYEITSLISIDEYKDVVEKLFHPAGLKMFGNVQTSETLEPIEKTPVTFLRWWIIYAFIHVFAQEKSIITNSYIIKNNPITNSFPWTADQQYYYKQYGLVSSVADMTPNDLLCVTNENNKLVFNNGLLILPNWGEYLLPDDIVHYDVAGIRCKYSLVVTECVDGIITLNVDQQVSDIPFIFINGVKVNDAYVTKTSTGFKIATGISGHTVIYSLTDDIIKRVIKTNITKNKIYFPRSDKRQMLIFINGEFLWDSIKYENNNILLPQESGALEVYELVNNELLFVQHYYIKDNKRNTLYYEYPLRNIINSISGKDYYYDIQFTYFTYKFPFTTDEQYKYKQYGIVNNVATMTPNDIYKPTNSSNKMVFVDGKLEIPDWSLYKFNNPTQHYCISGIRAAKCVIYTKCNNGIINLGQYKHSDEIIPFIFVNGLKIYDKDIVNIENGFSISDDISGDTVIYFIQKNSIAQTIKQDIINNNKYLTLEYSNKRRFIVFINNEFVWDKTLYNRNSVKLPRTRGYVELYEFINNEDLFTMEYNISDENNTTLYCYNPLKIINNYI